MTCGAEKLWSLPGNAAAFSAFSAVEYNKRRLPARDAGGGFGPLRARGPEHSVGIVLKVVDLGHLDFKASQP